MKSPGKSILKFSLYLVMGAGLSLAYAFLAFLLLGDEVVEIQTGGKETFVLDEPALLVLVDTNTGLGSSPGIIKADGGVRLFDPDGELCELNRDGYGNDFRRFGEYDLKKTGPYRFEIDEIAGSTQSRGALKSRDKLPLLGVAVWSGLALALLSVPMALLGGLALLVTPKKEVPQ
jgi:hypothetical protein